MAKCKLTNQKRFKALLLTLILLLVSCAYIFSACGTNDDDDDDENTTKTDTQTFANADFEYFDNNSKSYLIPTANSWSKSSGSNALGESASSSLAKSGIMDTSLVWSDVFPQAKKDYDTYKDTDKDDIPISTTITISPAGISPTTRRKTAKRLPTTPSKKRRTTPTPARIGAKTPTAKRKTARTF